MNLEFSRRYAMAHRLLSDRSSKCATPHGHNEIVTISLSSALKPDFGRSNMVAPFEALKRRWHGWIDDHVDHAFQIGLDDPLLGYFRTHEPDRLPKIMTFEGDPTTEALAAAFALKLAAFLAADNLPFRCESVSVEETPTNRVTLERAWDLRQFGAWTPGAWATAPDMSINDFEILGLAASKRA